MNNAGEPELFFYVCISCKIAAIVAPSKTITNIAGNIWMIVVRLKNSVMVPPVVMKPSNQGKDLIIE